MHVCVTVLMDSVWKDLPLDLAEHVCNQLPRVRQMAPELKIDLIFWPLQRLIRNTTNWYGRDDGYELLLDDLNMLTESDFSVVHDAWYAMDVDARLEYYHAVMD